LRPPGNFPRLLKGSLGQVVDLFHRSQHNTVCSSFLLSRSFRLYNNVSPLRLRGVLCLMVTAENLAVELDRVIMDTTVHNNSTVSADHLTGVDVFLVEHAEHLSGHMDPDIVEFLLGQDPIAYLAALGLLDQLLMLKAQRTAIEPIRMVCNVSQVPRSQLSTTVLDFADNSSSNSRLRSNDRSRHNRDRNRGTKDLSNNVLFALWPAYLEGTVGINSDNNVGFRHFCLLSTTACLSVTTYVARG